MAIGAGDRLGPYEILSELGSGGMGEVYRARDTRLGREVAVKLSREKFSERFEREARVIASLNHPNICTLHDVGPNYLVMELVDGASPAGPLRLDEALPIARQVAGALEAAHEKGVIHRDLKPGNVKVKADGTVKVLDFGLAKVYSAAAAESDDAPTNSPSDTEAGAILGTVAYMSPEQARGKPVDKRADIWAFGVMLYELLTGERPFRGDSSTDILAAVVGQEPDFRKIPPKARRLLQYCLQKDPKKRLRDIGDIDSLIDETPAYGLPEERDRIRRPLLPWSAAGALAFAFAFALWAPWRTPAEPPQPIRLEISIPENIDIGGRVFTLSPDGRKLAFSAAGTDGVPRVWVRFLDSLEIQLLAGTETPATAPRVFWSPDGRFVGYTSKDRKLKTVDLNGSPSQTLCDTIGPNATGGAWNSDGVVIFGSTTSGISRVPDAGGTPEPVTSLDPSRKETRHAFPTFLADGRRFLYLRTSSVPENSGVYLGSLDISPDKQDSRRLVATAFAPVYVPASKQEPGRLLIFREGNVLVYSFDESRAEILGDPVTVVQQIDSIFFTGLFSAAKDILVYRSSGGNQSARLTILDEKGSVVANPEHPSGPIAVEVSPDGTRAALVREDPANGTGDIWTWDTSRYNSTRLTFDTRRAAFPVWSPDGRMLVFASNREGAWNLHRTFISEPKNDEALLKSPFNKTPTGISSDGRFLLYTQTDPQSKNDVWVLPNLDEGPNNRKPAPFLNREFNETEARFSPESGQPHWVAYTSDETGRNEVFVREFFPNGRTLPVSRAGGSNPRWRSDGRELYFAAPDGNVMTAEITPGTALQISEPREKFPRLPAGMLSNWDVSNNGKKFLVLVPVPNPHPFTVVLNWEATLNR